MAPTILLTAFEPFGGDPVNPSLLIARQLHGETVAGARVVMVELPCVFHRALVVLDEALARTRPTLAVALGLAAGREGLSIERVAINVDDARIPDNVGAQPVDEAIAPEGPAAWFSTQPIKAMVAALKQAGVPASVSQTAGTFVCNHVFYGLQQRLAGTGVRSGFIHVPLLPEQAAQYPGKPVLALEDQVRGVRLALEVAMTHRGEDLRAVGGTVA
jgi:pyroglutamyl-peptidase